MMLGWTVALPWFALCKTVVLACPSSAVRNPGDTVVFPSHHCCATWSSAPRAGRRAAARPVALRAPPASPSGGRPTGGSSMWVREEGHEVGWCPVRSCVQSFVVSMVSPLFPVIACVLLRYSGDCRTICSQVAYICLSVFIPIVCVSLL